MSDEEQAWEDESSEAKRARKGKAAMTDEDYRRAEEEEERAAQERDAMALLVGGLHVSPEEARQLMDADTAASAYYETATVMAQRQGRRQPMEHTAAEEEAGPSNAPHRRLSQAAHRQGRRQQQLSPAQQTPPQPRTYCEVAASQGQATPPPPVRQAARSASKKQATRAQKLQAGGGRRVAQPTGQAAPRPGPQPSRGQHDSINKQIASDAILAQYFTALDDLPPPDETTSESADLTQSPQEEQSDPLEPAEDVEQAAAAAAPAARRKDRRSKTQRKNQNKRLRKQKAREEARQDDLVLEEAYKQASSNSDRTASEEEEEGGAGGQQADPQALAPPKQKRQKKQAKLKQEGAELFTIKTGLGSIIRLSVLWRAIEAAVVDMTQVCVETWNGLLILVARSCWAQQPQQPHDLEDLDDELQQLLQQPLPLMDQKFILSVMIALTGTRMPARANTIAPSAFVQKVLEHFYKPRNFWKRLRGWITMKIRQLESWHHQQLSCKKRKLLVDAVQKSIWNNVAFASPAAVAADHRALSDDVGALVAHVRQARVGLLPVKEHLYSEWHKFFPWLHTMLQDIEEHNRATRQRIVIARTALNTAKGVVEDLEAKLHAAQHDQPGQAAPRHKKRKQKQDPPTPKGRLRNVLRKPRALDPPPPQQGAHPPLAAQQVQQERQMHRPPMMPTPSWQHNASSARLTKHRNKANHSTWKQQRSRQWHYKDRKKAATAAAGSGVGEDEPAALAGHQPAAFVGNAPAGTSAARIATGPAAARDPRTPAQLKQALKEARKTVAALLEDLVKLRKTLAKTFKLVPSAALTPHFVPITPEIARARVNAFLEEEKELEEADKGLAQGKDKKRRSRTYQKYPRLDRPANITKAEWRKMLRQRRMPLLWETYFDLSGLRTAHHEPQAFLMTNGVQAHVQVKRKSQPARSLAVIADELKRHPERGEELERQLQEKRRELLKGKQWVAVDPGKRAWITAVSRSDNKSHHVAHQCTTKHHYQQTGSIKRRMRMERDLAAAPNGLQHWQSHLQRQDTANPVALETRLANLTTRLREVLVFYDAFKQRKWKWAAVVQRQRVLANEARRLCGGLPKHEYATVIPTREHLTSQSCPRCRLGWGRGQRSYSVRRCDKCQTYWDRDVAAAKNILQAARADVAGVARPRHLRRKPPPQPAPAAQHQPPPVQADDYAEDVVVWPAHLYDEQAPMEEMHGLEGGLGAMEVEFAPGWGVQELAAAAPWADPFYVLAALAGCLSDPEAEAADLNTRLLQRFSEAFGYWNADKRHAVATALAPLIVHRAYHHLVPNLKSYLGEVP
ncbi:hypothetical protein D9Q98_002551 [Chlorella vulgaris]|uniref:Cas12f1-like TNB domain-containing protein n=1 Tax=Chlorella vulgaris TaxID=3077 RepID=A0A9D4TUV9_CHLVU|nr:hypothetical protein D9Q98_002551 [Chlorella vulgaris]